MASFVCGAEKAHGVDRKKNKKKNKQNKISELNTLPTVIRIRQMYI